MMFLKIILAVLVAQSDDANLPLPLLLRKRFVQLCCLCRRCALWYVSSAHCVMGPVKRNKMYTWVPDTSFYGAREISLYTRGDSRQPDLFCHMKTASDQPAKHDMLLGSRTLGGYTPSLPPLPSRSYLQPHQPAPKTRWCLSPHPLQGWMFGSSSSAPRAPYRRDYVSRRICG